MPLHAITSGALHVPRGYEWIVLAVFLASLAVVLYVATGGRR
ncbi:hypothetical protein [Streptomyces verrucosisporus]|nr:hypothetical protein [Streptomyces verrucosisporus]